MIERVIKYFENQIIHIIKEKIVDNGELSHIAYIYFDADDIANILDIKNIDDILKNYDKCELYIDENVQYLTVAGLHKLLYTGCATFDKPVQFEQYISTIIHELLFSETENYRPLEYKE